MIHSELVVSRFEILSTVLFVVRWVLPEWLSTSLESIRKRLLICVRMTISSGAKRLFVSYMNDYWFVLGVTTGLRSTTIAAVLPFNCFASLPPKVGQLKSCVELSYSNALRKQQGSRIKIRVLARGCLCAGCILKREPWLENWGKRKKMFSFVVSKIFSPYYTSSKAFAYSLSRG